MNIPVVLALRRMHVMLDFTLELTLHVAPHTSLTLIITLVLFIYKRTFKYFWL